MSDAPISVAEARRVVLMHARAPELEHVHVSQAAGWVLGADVVAAGDAPPFDCSAMDGYAVVAGPARRLRVAGEARAGAPAAVPMAPDTAVRISTGAAIPVGADAVVRQEDTRADGAEVEILTEVPAGENIRRAGEDMTRGTPVLSAGVRLGPAELAAAVAAGAGELAVGVRPLVRVLCTGDELREPGEPLAPGQIHNSNGVMLNALAARCGARAGPGVVLPDEPAATAAGIEAALESDVVILCGGVSVGPHDHVKPALSQLGVEQRFWGVALQPGRPTWFGVRARTLVFALPGNPVSAAVTFTLFVRPALDALQGLRSAGAAHGRARLIGSPRRNPTREQAVRVRLHQGERGPEARLTGAQGSHLVTSLLEADALALVPAGEGVVPEGLEVRLEPAPGRW